MKIFDFRKYFFSYLYIIFSILFIYENWAYAVADLPIPLDDPVIPPGLEYRFFIFIYGLAYIASLIFLVIEMLLRKFVVEKYFPNLKFPIKISLPRKLNLFLSVVFYILFSLATVPIIIVLFFI